MLRRESLDKQCIIGYNNKKTVRRWGAIKTKRLIIKPLDDASLGKLLHRQTDPELIKAYGDMFLGCRRQPAARLWYTAWSISLYDGTMVGDICFKGPPNERGEVEIGYGILDGHQGHGYATEAVRAMCTWGFSMPGCYFIQAQTEPGNRASERVLEKSGFRTAGSGSEGRLWERERPSSATIPAFMCFGMAVGLAVGALAANNMELGICIGLVVGMTVGVIFDLSDRRKRKRK